MANKPKIGIVGAGAVGLTYAYFLSDVAEVVVKTRSKEQATELNKSGICMTRGGKSFSVSARATDVFGDLRDCDVVIIAVKSYDTEAVAHELNKVIPKATQVVSLQNGLQAVEVLKTTLVEPQRVFAGVTYIGARRSGAGNVALGKYHRTVLDPAASILVEALRSSKFGVETPEDIKQAVWDKVALNTGQNALSAATNKSAKQMLASPDCLAIATGILEEFQKVAEAEGLQFPKSLLERLKDNWDDGDDFYPSMWQDLHNGRRTEIDALNGAIEKLGQKHSIPTPYNSMITSLIRALEDPRVL